jgi:hypothetical protein
MRQSLKAQINAQIAQDWQIPLEGPYEFCPEDTFQGQIRMTISPKDLPALSAWILEYPVGYTFSEDSKVTANKGGKRRRIEAEAASTQRTNLDGEPLVLVKVKILGEKELGER